MFFLPSLEKHNAFGLAFSFSYLPQLFWNIGQFRAKLYFTDHQIANTIQLFVVVQGNVSGLFFF